MYKKTIVIEKKQRKNKIKQRKKRKKQRKKIIFQRLFTDKIIWKM
jgi:hypothetical protein